jgi:hypothetical protein
VGSGTSANGREAFRWTPSAGMVPLGDLPGGEFASYPNGVSFDGAIVVGWGNSEMGQEAFIWDAENGMRPLKRVLLELGISEVANWTLTTTYTSGDGSVMVGGGTNPNGDPEAWIAFLGAPPGHGGDAASEPAITP